MVVNKKLIQESRGDGMKTDEDHYENVVGIDNDAEHGDTDRDDSDTRILGNSIFFGCKLFLQFAIPFSWRYNRSKALSLRLLIYI